MINCLILFASYQDDIRYIFGRFWHLYILRKDHFRSTAYNSQQQHYKQQYHNVHQASRGLHSPVASQNNNNSNFFGPSIINYNPATPANSVTDGASQQQPSLSAIQVLAVTNANSHASGQISPDLAHHLPTTSTSSSLSSTSSRQAKVQFHFSSQCHLPSLDREVLETAALLISTHSKNQSTSQSETYPMHQTEVHLVDPTGHLSNFSATGTAAKENNTFISSSSI